MLLPSYWARLGVGRNLYFCGSALVGVLDKVDKDLFYLRAVGRQLSLTLCFNLRVKSCYVFEEITNREGRSLWCFDAR